MYVLLDDITILDMNTGTCYQRQVQHGKDEYNELHITFNGHQRDKFCSNEVADGLWDWLYKAALKFGTDKV